MSLLDELRLGLGDFQLLRSFLNAYMGLTATLRWESRIFRVTRGADSEVHRNGCSALVFRATRALTPRSKQRRCLLQQSILSESAPSREEAFREQSSGPRTSLASSR